LKRFTSEFAAISLVKLFIVYLRPFSAISDHFVLFGSETNSDNFFVSLKYLILKIKPPKGKEKKLESFCSWYSPTSKLPPPRSNNNFLLLGLRLLQEYNNTNKNLFKTFENLNSEIIGAYTLAIIDSNNIVYGVRDPVGFRPLCIGYHQPSKSYIISSESCALDAIEAKLIRDVEPGEIVSLSENGLKSYKFNTEKTRAHCSFEYIYFAHPSSSIDGVNVYSTRKKIGQILAKNKKLKADLIIPVPDSARPAALGYSQASNINLEEGLIKDRYKKRGSLRSFIEPTQKRRESIVKQIIPISASIKNKDIIVVDDSLVRGTSLKVLTKTLKKAGAKKIKLAFTFPPISFPCYMGIDFPTQNELLAYKVLSGSQDFKLVAKTISKKLHVDEIIFNDLNGLSQGIGIPLDNLCTACITGDYSALKYKPNFKSKRERKNIS